MEALVTHLIMTEKERLRSGATYGGEMALVLV